jgi:hypothetical protein
VLLFVLEYRIVRQLGFIPGGCGQGTAVPETAPGECKVVGEVGPADGYGETGEATRGDYEDNPPDRSVAKSAHSVRLRSAAGKGKMSRGEGCIHSMETDGLQHGHQRGANSEWQPNETVVGRVERGEGRGERTEGEGTGNPRTCSEKCRVTCKGTGMREIACLAHATRSKAETRRTPKRLSQLWSVSYRSTQEDFHLRVLLRPTCHLSRTAVLQISFLRLIVVVSF